MPSRGHFYGVYGVFFGVQVDDCINLRHRRRIFGHIMWVIHLKILIWCLKRYAYLQEHRNSLIRPKLDLPSLDILHFLPTGSDQHLLNVAFKFPLNLLL